MPEIELEESNEAQQQNSKAVQRAKKIGLLAEEIEMGDNGRVGALGEIGWRGRGEGHWLLGAGEDTRIRKVGDII